jgi:hypothetical protein
MKRELRSRPDSEAPSGLLLLSLRASTTGCDARLFELSKKRTCNLTSLPEKVTFTLCDNHCSKTLNFIEVLNMPERTELVDKIVLNSLQTYFENWPLATAEDIVIFIQP